jgi:hypothetical protein
VIARQLATDLVNEPGLVGTERCQRVAENEIGNVVGAVLSDRQQEQRQAASRVVVESAEGPKSRRASRPAGVRRTLPRCGSAW